MRRMLKKPALWLALAFGLMSHEGKAQSFSAKDILPGCRAAITEDKDEFYHQGICLGIIGALFHLGKSHLQICPPDDVTVDQALRIVVAMVGEKSEQSDEHFANLALEALQRTWPCKR
jgi:hypothetical protein